MLLTAISGAVCRQTSRTTHRLPTSRGLVGQLASVSYAHSRSEPGKRLLSDPDGIKMGWSKDVISSVIPFSSQLFSSKGRMFDNIAVCYSPQRAPQPIENSSQQFTRRVDDSFIEIILPFTDQPDLRESMVESDGRTILYGKMFEIFDGLAGDVGYRHAGSHDSGLTIVTACVDGMQAITHLTIDTDIKLQGYLSYVGRSSMEVSIDILAVDHNGNSTVVGQTQFIMVARTAAQGKAFPIHGLEIHNEDGKARFALGASRVNARRDRAATSLAATPPRPEEIQTIHDLYLLTLKIKAEKEAHVLEQLNKQEFLQSKDISKEPATEVEAESTESTPAVTRPLTNPKFRFMKSTVMSNVQVMPTQERNVHGKVFGGYIMRKAYEIARVCAIFFYGVAAPPQFCFIDDVQFVKPVTIGSIMEFTATAVFSKDGKVVVQVLGNEVNPKIGRRTKTNLLTFVFKNAENCTERIPEIIPKEYPEVVLYLEGMRSLYQTTVTPGNTVDLKGK